MSEPVRATTEKRMVEGEMKGVGVGKVLRVGFEGRDVDPSVGDRGKVAFEEKKKRKKEKRRKPEHDK